MWVMCDPKSSWGFSKPGAGGRDLGNDPEPRAESGYTLVAGALEVSGYLALTWPLIKVLIS